MMSRSYTSGEHPIIQALFVVLGCLVALPIGFSYFVLSKSLRSQNVCHVGPVPLTPNQAVKDVESWLGHRQKLIQLYGTYTTFDDASYYFVKTPYDIHPLCLPSFGWWSITTLSLTLLSPKIRQARQLHYRRDGDTYNIQTSPAIQWDQSNRIKEPPKFSSNQHSSTNNRWCAVNTQDHTQYSRQHEPTSTDEYLEEKRAQYVFGLKAMNLVKSNQPPRKELFRICAPSQASILSSGDQAPYFVELPLQPPEAGRWHRYEFGTIDGTKTTTGEYETTDDDESDDNVRTKYRIRSRPTSPYQLQVQCHVRDMDLSHLAHGSLQPNSQPHLGWEHAEFIESPTWNPLDLPATMLVLVALLVGNIWPNDKCTDKHWIRKWQLGLTHPTWGLCVWTLVWVYILGACLEPLLGSMTLLTMHTTLFLWVSLWRSTSSYLWVVFGLTIILAQLEPKLQMGPIQIFALSFGDSASALKINVLSAIVGLYPMLSVFSSQLDWQRGFGVVFMGWTLTHPVCQEIMGAPQWTLPTILMGDLWWNLNQLGRDGSKKTDDELEPIMEVEDEDESEDDDDSMIRDSPSVFSLSSEMPTTNFQRIVKYGTVLTAYLFFSFWFILTFFCCMAFDWTLVIAHIMVLWMCIGSTAFSRSPLWSLYHMVAACWLLLFNVMTLVGWSFCHVAITTHAQHALPPMYVWTCLGLQTALHAVAFCITVCTRHWRTSPNVPGHYFWNQIKVIENEIYLWYRALT